MKRRLFVLALAAMLCLQLLPAGFAAETNLCAHHQTHEGCGWEEGSPAAVCTHGEHTDLCWEAKCTHVCDDTCQLVESVCAFSCTGEEDCLTKVLTCGHRDDGSCCAQAEVPAQDCGYSCPICPVQAQIDALPEAEEVTADNAEAMDKAIDGIHADILALMTETGATDPSGLR